MNKTTKTTLQFILGGLLFVTIAATSCNNKDSKTETTETSVTPAPVNDSTNIIDTGDVKPTPGGN